MVDVPKRSVFSGRAELDVSMGALGHMLARNRHRQGLSQVELAQRMATSQSAIARIEAGATDVRLSTLVRYADALGVSLAIELGD